MGITILYRNQPNWKKKQWNRIETVARQEWDINRENALIILNLGLLYLDFIDTYHSGFNTRVEKYIQCFAVIFQDLIVKNYTGKTMYIVAYLKKILQPEFKYMITLGIQKILYISSF